MQNEKDYLGAQGATVGVTAGSIAPDAASHVGHTRGPWQVEGDISDNPRRAIQARAFDDSWKNVVDRVRGGSRAETLANAHLIAAAPELYANLRGILAIPGVRAAIQKSVYGSIEYAADDAIAKAEGRSA